MRLSRRRSPRLVAAGILTVAATAGLLLAGVASAHDDDVKPFTATVTVSPDADALNPRADAWVGSTPTITISIKNGARTQLLGSANITVPAGIVPDPALATGNVIQLRNLKLKPGATTSVNLTAQVPCAADPAGYPWVVQVKQSNDFNGVGNDFKPTTLPPRLFGSGACSLAFTADGQPTGAQRLTNITDEPFLPTSALPVAVRVVDGSGTGTATSWTAPIDLAIAVNPGAGTLSGTTSVIPQAGVARFLAAGVGPQIDRSGGGYRLTASSPGITAAPPVSNPFDIVDSGQRCAGGACTGSTSSATVSASVTTNAAANDLLLLSLGAADAPTFSCPNYVATGDTLAFDVTTLAGAPAGSAKTVLYKVLNPTRPAGRYNVCFRSLSPFTAKVVARAPFGDDDDVVSVLVPAPQQPDGSYVGLLPGCRRVANVAPCVVSRTTVLGTVVLTVSAPAGDPWLRG